MQECTRARTPLQWAATQNNLGEVYRAFFTKDHLPRHLDEAFEAVDGALEEFRNAKANFYIEKTERLRTELLAMKGNPKNRAAKK